MLFIDYEKACDKIDWGFIVMMLEALGFLTHYCRMVFFFLFGVKATMEINGVRSEFFSLTRSIRQGCPLAPSLFMIASDSLHYLLRDNSLSPCVRGILLPNNQEVANVWFVDDISILLYLEETNMTYLMEKLDTFYLASGSKISISKSIMLRWTKEPLVWWSKFDLAWGGSDHLVRYLGIPFSVESDLNLMWVGHFKE